MRVQVFLHEARQKDTPAGKEREEERLISELVCTSEAAALRMLASLTSADKTTAAIVSPKLNIPGKARTVPVLMAREPLSLHAPCFSERMSVKRLPYVTDSSSFPQADYAILNTDEVINMHILLVEDGQRHHHGAGLYAEKRRICGLYLHVGGTGRAALSKQRFDLALIDLSCLTAADSTYVSRLARKARPSSS